MHRRFASWFVLVLGVAVGPAFGDDLLVLPEGIEGQPSKGMLRRDLDAKATAAFARRKATYESLKSAEDVAAYQQRLRAFLLERLGEFPERTPLNPILVGRIDRDDCTVERVMFESRPRFRVTANLYLPKSPPPYPGVIVPCGHSANGKAYEAYQRISILLARNGIAALCYDPIGQGERYQLLNDDGQRRFGATDEHTHVGVGSILVGRSTAHYRIWDGIRALDYLASREEIDPERLGCTGNSGGGTLTQYLMAIDDRIRVAVPSCCVTTFDRRLATNRLGDAEQNVFGQIAYGLDHADYTLLRAPKPTLLATATHDFMDIEGAWDIFRESKRLYTRLGYAERIDLIEVDGKHGYSKPKREAAVRWMRRWLLGEDSPITEPEFPTLAEQDLLCTSRGQVNLIAGARTVMDENANLAELYAPSRTAKWQSPERALERVRSVAGIRPLSELSSDAPEHVGTVERDGHRIEKLVFPSEPRIVLPALRYFPAKPRGEPVLFLHGDGKSADPEAIGTLVAAGHEVLAVDLRGLGETGPGSGGAWGGGWSELWITYLLGESLVGKRAEDVLVVARWMSKQHDTKVRVVAEGVTTVPSLHAVALEPSLFARLESTGGPRTWMTVVREGDTHGQLVHAVHGALAAYDLPDLVREIERRGIEVVDESDTVR